MAPLSRLPTPSDFPSSVTMDIIPPSSGCPVNILILLHGLGDTNKSFTSLAKNLNLPETACLSLQAPTPLPSLFTGSPTPAFHWGDDVFFHEVTGEIDVDAGFKASSRVVNDVLQVLMGPCRYPPRNIFFLGFGQGAMAALSSASLAAEMEFGGVVSIAGKLPSSLSSSLVAKRRTPVLVCGGRKSTQITRGAIDGLKARFADVEYVRWEKAGDSMPGSREEMLPIMKFFARRLKSWAGVPEGAVEV